MASWTAIPKLVFLITLDILSAISSYYNNYKYDFLYIEFKSNSCFFNPKTTKLPFYYFFFLILINLNLID